MLERWTGDRTNLRLRVINGSRSPGKVGAARSKSAPSLPRASRRRSQAISSSNVDMLDASTCPTTEASRGTAPRTSRRIYQCTSQQLSRGSSAPEESENDGLRPSDMQAWAMGAPAPGMADHPKAAERPRSTQTPSLKRSASIAGLPESGSGAGACFQGPLRRARKLPSLYRDIDSREDHERQMMKHAEAAPPHTPIETLANGGCLSLNSVPGRPPEL